MTYSQMKTAFLEGYDYISNHMAAGLEDAEISALLTEAYEDIIDNFVKNSNIAAVAELLEKFTANLIVCSLEDYGSCAYTPDAAINTIRHITNARLKLSRSEPLLIANEWVDVEIISKVVADRYVQTSFNKPIIIFPKLVEYGTTQIVLVDTLTTVTQTNGFQLIYIEHPVPIDVTAAGLPEINSKYHKDIVDLAVKLAWKAVEPKVAMEQIQVDKQL
jgi:hypothetical protein